MTQEKPPNDEPPKTNDSKGEFILIGVLAVFVVFAIIGMMVIDHYGTKAMGDPTHIRDAADR